MKKILELLIIGVIFWLIVSLVFKEIFSILRFGFFMWYLFYLPFVPWVNMIKIKRIEKFILINLLGLGFVPALWFTINFIGLPLNKFVYLGVPVLVFISGIIYQEKK